MVPPPARIWPARPRLVPVSADRARGRGRGSLGSAVCQRPRAARRVRDCHPGHGGAVTDPEPGVLPRLQGRQFGEADWSVATTGPTTLNHMPARAGVVDRVAPQVEDGQQTGASEDEVGGPAAVCRPVHPDWRTPP